MRGKGKTLENEKINQETLWSNMGRLMRIIFLQFRSVCYCIVLLAILMPFWSLLQTYIEVSGDLTPWYLQICGGGHMELIIMVGILLAFSYNILSRNEISMYPGTVFTRYSATVLVFHIMILLSAVLSVVSYLLQGFLLWVASHLWENIILGNVFSLSYLWYGSVRYLGLSLAGSAIGIFWFVLIERFRPIRVYLCTFPLFVCIIILAAWGYLDGIMKTVKNLFLGNGYSYAALIAVLFGIWVVFMLLSSCLAGTVRVWREADRTRLIVTFILVYFLFIGGVFMMLFQDGVSYEMDPMIFQQESNQQAEVVVDISEWKEQDRELLNDYDMSVKYRKGQKKNSTFQREVVASVSCSASEAKQYGLSFDESKLDQDHIILLLGTRNLTFAGKDLGEGALQAYQQSTKLVKDFGDEQYQEEYPEERFQPDYYYQTEITNDPVIVINNLYGNLGMYLNDTTLNRDSGFWGNLENVTESLLRIVIYPD